MTRFRQLIRCCDRLRMGGRECRERGQSLAEYALILLLVALASIAALGALGSAIAGSPGFDLFS